MYSTNLCMYMHKQTCTFHLSIHDWSSQYGDGGDNQYDEYADSPRLMRRREGGGGEADYEDDDEADQGGRGVTTTMHRRCATTTTTTEDRRDRIPGGRTGRSRSIDRRGRIRRESIVVLRIRVSRILSNDDDNRSRILSKTTAHGLSRQQRILVKNNTRQKKLCFG